ncbi:MAG TPA: serine protease [Candidatus Paceibacterota bacterium]|nr:serine protease [Candidatus Paceibacterota bacterium]
MNKKDILNLFLMIVSGAFGGLLVLFFCFKENNSLFSPLVINQTEERVYIEQNAALIKSIKETKRSLFQGKQADSSFSGVVLTSDGLAITLASNVTTKNVITCLVDKEQYPCQVLKKDINQNLALLKIDKDKLSTNSFFDYEKMEIGERIYLLYYLDSGELSVNEGIVKSFDSDLIKTNIREVEAVNGSPVFSVDNKIVGLTLKDANGFVSVIPVSLIRTFAGL